MFAPTDADEARRFASLDVMTERFPAVEQRVSQVTAAPAPPYRPTTRRARPTARPLGRRSGVTIGPVHPPGSGDPRAGQAGERLDAYRTDEARTRGWIAEATAELAAGQPAFALTLGRELHWLDADPFRREAVDLLTGAYRALGRDALAGVAEVHAAHRDLPSVDVLS